MVSCPYGLLQFLSAGGVYRFSHHEHGFTDGDHSVHGAEGGYRLMFQGFSGTDARRVSQCPDVFRGGTAAASDYGSPRPGHFLGCIRKKLRGHGIVAPAVWKPCVGLHCNVLRGCCSKLVYHGKKSFRTCGAVCPHRIHSKLFTKNRQSRGRCSGAASSVFGKGEMGADETVGAAVANCKYSRFELSRVRKGLKEEHRYSSGNQCPGLNQESFVDIGPGSVTHRVYELSGRAYAGGWYGPAVCCLNNRFSKGGINRGTFPAQVESASPEGAGQHYIASGMDVCLMDRTKNRPVLKSPHFGRHPCWHTVFHEHGAHGAVKVGYSASKQFPQFSC